MIVFHKIKYKNLLAVGNSFFEIELNKVHKTLIMGENGSAKSTLLDALTFVLFGKPFRKINKPQLVNSINKKNCEVQIEFSIYEDLYRVVRGMYPTTFEIYKNDVLLNQDASIRDYQKYFEENILKTNYNTFCQVVILGASNYIPFMRLTPNERRNVVENILDISILSDMLIESKNRLSQKETELYKRSTQLQTMKRDIENQNKIIQLIEENQNTNIEEIQKELSELHVKYNDIKTQYDSIVLDDSIEKEYNRLTQENEKLQNLIHGFDKKIANFKDKLRDSMGSSKVCSSCGQSIPESKMKEIQDYVSKKLDDLEEKRQLCVNKFSSTTSVLSNYKNQMSIHDEQKHKKQELYSSLRSIEYVMKDNEKKIEKYSIRTNDNLIKEQESLIELKGEYSTHKEEYLVLNRDKKNYEIVKSLLQDSGVKSKIIKYYLPNINEIINRYLLKMGLNVDFYIDENFSETIQSKYRDRYCYENFSEGEKLRIDMCIMFAWREVAKLKNSVNCNLLIMDEIFDSSLDVNGIDDFMKILNSDMRELNIFIISHKVDVIQDKFDEEIVVRKKNGFSVQG